MKPDVLLVMFKIWVSTLYH